MVEKLVEIGTLFEFYGKLLSDRQYSVVELYYIHDLSLAEIGEELNITRQGVFDSLKRGEQNLYDYDTKLKLIKKFHVNHDNIREIIGFINEIMESLDNLENDTISKDIRSKIWLIKNISKDILNNNQEV
ncbi:MAG TPA: sigma factor-like helix-turn-helix DNA-binding protein [Tissierellaceae bacterium]|nr:sigma factor-like helix-turn-helix DNA-binding protein [Tissierellaceae bacterium]